MQQDVFDFEVLQSEIVHAAKLALKEFSVLHKTERICAFALYSDEGAMTVCNAINTTGYLAECQQENPDDALYYKFEPAEWKYESVFGNGAFNELSKKTAAGADKKGSNFSKFKQNLFESCVLALTRLKSEFDSEVLLLFAVSDSYIGAQQLKWVQQLNNPANSTEFKQFMGESA